jgi:hypothetical protein
MITCSYNFLYLTSILRYMFMTYENSREKIFSILL